MDTIREYVEAFGFNGDGGLYLQAFVVVFLAMLADFVMRSFLRQLHKQVAKTENFWDDILIDAARRPASMLIWMVGISWAAEILAGGSEAVIFAVIGPLRELLVIILLAWFLVGFIKRAEVELVNPKGSREPVDQTTATAIGKLLRISIIITAVLILLQSLGYSISGVLAFGGIGGIAVGFAAKDLLANFFGGVMIYLDRPFTVGDWIRSPDKNIEGTVEDIGWRLTRIRTFDKRPLYVPNATFTNISVENPSRMTNRRIKETIGIRYDDAAELSNIIEAVKTMLQQHEDIDTNQTLIVNFNSYGPSSLDFFIYTFTKTTNWIRFHEVKQDVLIKIYQIIGDHGADVAYPTQTIHLPDELKLQGDHSGEQP